MSGPVYIDSHLSAVNTHIVYTPTAGNDVVIGVFGIGGTPALTTVTSSLGESSIQDFAFSNTFAYYRFHNVLGGSHTFSPTWGTAPTHYWLMLTEAQNLLQVDATGAASISTGTSINPLTNVIDLTTSSALCLAMFSINHVLTSLGSWTNGFTQDSSFVSGPAFGAGHVQGAFGPVSTEITISGSFAWTGIIIGYAGGNQPYMPYALQPTVAQ